MGFCHVIKSVKTTFMENDRTKYFLQQRFSDRKNNRQSFDSVYRRIKPEDFLDVSLRSTHHTSLKSCPKSRFIQKESLFFVKISNSLYLLIEFSAQQKRNHSLTTRLSRAFSLHFTALSPFMAWSGMIRWTQCRMLSSAYMNSPGELILGAHNNPCVWEISGNPNNKSVST